MRALPIRLTMLLIALVAVAAVAFWWRTQAPALPSSALSPEELRRLAAQLKVLEVREQHAAETHWAPELLAQKCGAVFERFWDTLNAYTNKLAIAAGFAADEYVLPTYENARRLPHGIEVFDPNPAAATVSWDVWQARLKALSAMGWELVQCEFRHNRFQPDPSGQPKRSVFWFAAHLVNAPQTNRAALVGDLRVDWSSERDSDGLPLVRRVDAGALRLSVRTGPPAFQRVLHEVLTPPPKSHFIDPLLVHDLDGDATNEVVLASANAVFTWRGDRFERGSFCREGPGLIATGVLADFDGDGRDDFLCARFAGLFLFRGGEPGAFAGSGESVWAAPARLRYGQVLTAADADGDGDLDVWLGQYKNPYDGGQMPTPFYDANDGNPSYLLLNDGHGRFTDATEDAGLTTKRWRRTYSASLADLDTDGDADLLVVNDFAGVDVYLNDGRGHFRDATATWLPDSKVFGMSHAIADFDIDGHLDLLVTGMHCPTALRLDALGLSRPERPDYAAMRGRMVRGNRLWRGLGQGRFTDSPALPSIAQSGWSWGSAAADFDNDGFPDVYITNGHETRQHTRDYDTEFWLHDIYAGASKEDPAVLAYFTSKLGRTRGHGMSYGGWEKNRLYLNLAGREFAEVGHLFGVAVEQDSRNLVADDFDGDGRVDLIFTTFETWPRKQQTVQVWKNHLPGTGNWIGLRLDSRLAERSVLGGRVTLTVGDRTTGQLVLTGDSHRSQRSSTLHFGLGTNSSPAQLQVLPLGGASLEVNHVEPGRYHRLPAR